MGISIDMTKFMDTYSNHAIQYQDVAARDVGAITEDEYTVLAYTLTLMRRKAVLIPQQYKESLERMKKRVNKVGMKGTKYYNLAEKHLREFKEGVSRLNIDDNTVKEILSTNELLREIAMNDMGVKEFGLVLGTYNKNTSIHSIGIF